jgi:hypothetical protein
MNPNDGNQELREMLLTLEVTSPRLVEEAEDWLKPILNDSIEYHRLKEEKAYSLKRVKEAPGAIPYIIVIGFLSSLCWLISLRDNVNILYIILSAAGLFLILTLFYWSNKYLHYMAFSKKLDRFFIEWVGKVQTVPENVTRLKELHQTIQTCESSFTTINSRIRPDHEQILEYILVVKNDPAQLLQGYLSAICAMSLETDVKYYLTRRLLPFTLIYLYHPEGLFPFMKACHGQYQAGPFSFNSTMIEKLFDQYVPRTQENKNEQQS